MTFPNAKPLIYSAEVSQPLDFVTVHFYPESGKLDTAVKALRAYDIGKPVVIEEMFPLRCSTGELDQFIERSQPLATGWISFYWGKTIEEYQKSKRNISESITLEWLQYFVRKTPEIVSAK